MIIQDIATFDLIDFKRMLVKTIIILLRVNKSDKTVKSDKPHFTFNLDIASVNKQKADRSWDEGCHCQYGKSTNLL